MMTNESKPSMKKPMAIMLISLGILFGLVFLYKGAMKLLMNHYFATHQNPIQTVSTTKVAYAPWQLKLNSVGSLRATLGVQVTAELAGMIQRIYFTPGSIVNEGTVLVQQNANANIAQLQALQANAELAKITYARDQLQYRVHGISKQQLDADAQNLKSLIAQVAEQLAIVNKLTIKAPFSGRLGISNVNPGQYLNPGDKIVSLQRLDPIYVDFYLPQQALVKLKVGQTVNFVVDAFGSQVFSGKITTIEPIVDTNTRNVEVEATVANPQYQLLPGMFVNVEVHIDHPQSYLTVPQTAITFNSYGDLVYVVKPNGQGTDGKPAYVAKQVFVTTGDTRGNQIAVLKGLHEGDIVVTSGQLKLKNGSRVAINNTIMPSDSPDPSLPDEYGEA